MWVKRVLAIFEENELMSVFSHNVSVSHRKMRGSVFLYSSYRDKCSELESLEHSVELRITFFVNISFRTAFYIS